MRNLRRAYNKRLRDTIFNYDVIQDWHWYKVDFSVKFSQVRQRGINDKLKMLRLDLCSYFNCLPVDNETVINGLALKGFELKTFGRQGNCENLPFWQMKPRKDDAFGQLLEIAIKQGFLTALKTNDYVFR